jgi:hypothetical protein
MAVERRTAVWALITSVGDQQREAGEKDGGELHGLSLRSTRRLGKHLTLINFPGASSVPACRILIAQIVGACPNY